MGNRLIDDFDQFLFCPRHFRICPSDGWQRPEDCAGNGQQKARQAKQSHDMADGAARSHLAFNTVNWGSRRVTLAPAPAESRAGLIGVHQPMFEQAG